MWSKAAAVGKAAPHWRVRLPVGRSCTRPDHPDPSPFRWPGAQGLSYYGTPTLARRLRLSDEQFAAARQQLIELDLIAYRSPLYQVLALPGTVAARRPAPRAPAITSATTGANIGGQPVSLATLLQQA